jgi:glucuronate isomerase
MKKFLDEDFLLETRTAAFLYHEVAHDLPILDYHCHLELRRPFGITGTLLAGRSARAVYDRCHELLQTDEFTTQGLLRQFRVVAVCSTDDSTDSLEPHRAHARAGNPGTRLFPTWRPDKALAVEDPAAFNTWVDRLAGAADTDVRDYPSLLDALRKRHEFFHRTGCRLSDHGLEQLYTEADLRGAVDQLRAGRAGDGPGPEVKVGPSLRAGPHGPRPRLGAAVPPGRVAKQQHAADR